MHPRLQNICAKNIGAHKCINRYWKYTQIFAATKSSETYCKEQAKLIAKIKLGRTYCKIIKILALA
jgi:hypothetical protein